MKMFGKYLKIRANNLNTGKNGAQRRLILKNWHPRYAESQEDLSLEVIPKEGVETFAQDLPENFSGTFGKIRARHFRHPKFCLLLHLFE